MLLLCFRSPWHATPQATALATTAKQRFSWRPSPWPKQMNILCGIVEFVWLYLEMAVNNSCQYCHKGVFEDGWSHQRRMPWVCTTQKKACNACLLALSFLYGWRHSQNLWLGHMQQFWCPSSNWSSILIALLVCKHWKRYLEGVPKTEKGAKGRGTIGEGSTSLLLLIAQTVGSSPFRLFKSGQVCFSCTEWHAPVWQMLNAPRRYTDRLMYMFTTGMLLWWTKVDFNLIAAPWFWAPALHKERSLIHQSVLRRRLPPSCLSHSASQFGTFQRSAPEEEVRYQWKIIHSTPKDITPSLPPPTSHHSAPFHLVLLCFALFGNYGLAICVEDKLMILSQHMP